MSKPIIIRPTDHQAWLDSRKEGIGASEVGMILGLSPFKTAYQLWRLKTGLDMPEPENEAMIMGHLLEDAVAQRFAIATGCTIIKASAADIIYCDAHHPYMRVTPDRFVKMPVEGGKTVKALLECKTTSKMVDPDNVPLSWLCQVQYQMHVTGIHEAYLAWLVNGRTFGYLKIEFDQELVDTIVTAVSDFWHINVKQNIEPDMTSAEDVKIKTPVSTLDKAIEADNQFVQDAIELKAINDQIGELTAKADEIKNRIQLFMSDSEFATYQGRVLCTWKSGKGRETFDSKSFAKDHPDLYCRYIKTGTPTRLFKLKDF